MDQNAEEAALEQSAKKDGGAVRSGMTAAASMPDLPANNNAHLRRALRLESMDDAVREAERVSVAERAGTLACKGNWSAGQAMGHLAAWMHFGFDGYPVLRPPEELVARAMARKDVAFRDGLRAGVYIPGVEGGTAGIEALSVEEGLGRYRAGWARLAAGTPTHPHPFFGALTRDEWFLLHLRHTELHLSYLHPEIP